MSPRRGVSMAELLVATAILALLVVTCLSLLHGEVRAGAELDRRETADALARDMLSRLSRLPPLTLAELLPGGELHEMEAIGERAYPALEDLRDGGLPGYRRFAGFQAQGGEQPAYRLEVRVTWSRRGGPPGQITHLARLLGGSGFDQGLETAGGFTRGQGRGGSGAVAPEVEWGQASVWKADALGASDWTGKQRGSGATPADSALARRVRRAALGAQAGGFRLAPSDDGREVTVLGGVRLIGDREAALALVGPRGFFASTVPAQRRRRPARQVLAAFQRRTGLAGTAPRGDEVPDGVYRYRLEAVRLPGEGGALGAHELTAAEQPARWLVGRELEAGPAWMEGDEVLASEVLAAPDGAAWLVQRTLARVYLVELGPAGTGTLEVRTLPAPDGSREGTGMTRRRVESLRKARQLEARPGLVADARLTRALGDASPQGRAVQALRCGPGTGCRVGISGTP